MSEKGLIIINSYVINPNNLYKIKRLKEEFLPYGITLEVKDAISMLPLCYGDKTQLDLSAYSFCIDMDKDMYLAKIISQSIPLFNSYESMMLSDDKMKSILALKGSGIKVPLTIPAPLCYTQNPKKETVSLFLDKVERSLSYPLVFKECQGSLGRQVKLIRSREELTKTEYANLFVPHLYEAYLSRHSGHDYRIIIIDDKVICCMERINLHDFRSNIALGGKGYDVTNNLPDSYKEVALKAAKKLGLIYAGIDIGTDDEDNPVFIEANGNAFFTEVEEVCHVNVAKALSECIQKRIHKK